MGAGLRKSLVPVFVGGAIDTKSDPRLVEAGSLLELENMYMQRTGELRWRNGFTSLTKSQANGGAVTGLSSIFKSPSGALCILASSSTGGPPSARTFLQYDAGAPVWRVGGDTNPMPTVTSDTRPVSYGQISASGGINDFLARTDGAIAGAYVLTCWTDAGGTGSPTYTVQNYLTGAIAIGVTSISGVTTRTLRVAAGGSAYFCLAYSDNAGVPNLIVKTITLSTMAVTTTTVAANLVLAGVTSPVSLRSKPGSSNVLIAYQANAGGVTVLEFNPATNTVVTGPTNIAAANANLAMSWLEDQASTGSYFLATAGTAAGVVTRVLSGALAVTATNVIDATATIVRSVTGYVRTGVSDYDVLWDVSAAPLYNSIIKRGRWTGAATVVTYARSFSLASAAFKGPDGLYYMLAGFDSATQSNYLLMCASLDTAGAYPVSSPQCQLLYQKGRQFLTNTSTNPSVAVSADGKYVIPVAFTVSGFDSNGFHTGITQLRLNFSSSSYRPRELGGTEFIPGGVLSKYDGSTATWATLPIYPEQPTLSSSAAGGALTPAASYDYFTVYKRTDASGRVIRSAPSVAKSITLGGADNTVTVVSPTLRTIPINNDVISIEIYRRGPTATGATTINRIIAIPNDPTVDTVSTNDTTSDITAATGELLYTTGGVLENFPPPSHRLLEVNSGRLWVVNSEDPTELWPSKEYKPGVGIGFHQLLAFRVTGDGYGGITALAAMDGRLIVFKSSAIYIIQGDGPDDTGGGGNFNNPQAVSLSIGTVLPGSVVHTPDGIMFQSSKGLYLLSRGFVLTYLGKQVEKYTLIENVVDASLVDNATQVRFVMASGRCLVWDYDLQRWYTFVLPVGSSTIVACANISGGWCYALADGTVKQEVAGQYADDGVAIVPRITFPNMDTAGINGFQRVYAIQVLGEYVGDHTLTASIEYDYDRIAVPSGSKAITAGAYQYEIIPRQKCSAIKLTLSCTLLSGSGGFRLSGVSFLVGVKHGSNIPYTKRLT